MTWRFKRLESNAHLVLDKAEVMWRHHREVTMWIWDARHRINQAGILTLTNKWEPVYKPPSLTLLKGGHTTPSSETEPPT